MSQTQNPRIRIKLRRLSKHAPFYGLLKRFYKRDLDITKLNTFTVPKPTELPFEMFNRYYVPLLATIYIGLFTKDLFFNKLSELTATTCNYMVYYAKRVRFDQNAKKIRLPRIFFQTYTINNFVVFSKPRKNLFLMFFKRKPSFIFTCGLMRLVLNEKKKSSKKLAKVSISLIKLSVILLRNNMYFNSGYLKIINLGSLREKILKLIQKNRISSRIHYVIITLTRSYSAQKFRTRRSIKKYIKKRFKIQ